MLVILDKDGTLVGPLEGPPASSTWQQQPLDGVVQKLTALRAQGHALAIATNQGGVAWGFISRSQAYRLAHDAAEKVGGVDAVAVCCYHPGAVARNPASPYAKASPRRKPAPGMILDLMRRLGYGPADTIYVGDYDTDRQAAETAGVRFIWAQEFFG